MHPYMLEGIAQAHIADMHRAAAAYAPAGEASGQPRTARKHRIGRRRPHRVELVWPDGVSSVVELSRPAESARNEGRGLAGSRR